MPIQYHSLKKFAFQATRIPKRYFYRIVFRAIRSQRFNFAAFVCISNSIRPVICAISVLVKVIHNHDFTQENIVLYKSLMVVIAAAEMAANWYFKHDELCLIFKHPRIYNRRFFK
jgi:hypothetical protein